MKTIAIPTQSTDIYTKKYVRFKGVDFSTDPSEVDSSRSPFALNMVSDSGGYPEKRLGWRKLFSCNAKINGIHSTIRKDGSPLYLVHAGTNLYPLNNLYDKTTLPPPIPGISDSPSVSFYLNGKLGILTGNEYIISGYDEGEKTEKIFVLTNAGMKVYQYDSSAKTYRGKTPDAYDNNFFYIPTTSIARTPAGGGTSYEGVNILQQKRYNLFQGNGSDKVFQLDAANLDSAVVAQVWILNPNTAAWDEKTFSSDWTIDWASGKLTFQTAPDSPAVVGKDNVKVLFGAKLSGEKDQKSILTNCTVGITYGVGTNDRLFLSGNPKYKNRDWYSELNDLTYFPDLNYTLIGSEKTAVMGYLRLGEYLCIVKESDSSDNTIFLRSAALETVNDEKTAVFPLKQGIVGIGAISRASFSSLYDEPLFLGSDGVYGIQSRNITSEKVAQNRSCFLNPRLSQEENLQNAVCTVWNGAYLLCVNGRCYVMDGKQKKAYRSNVPSDYVYECYYWENIPAVCFLEQDGHLFFGTKDGFLCRFNDDISSLERFSDGGTLDAENHITQETASPITALWSTAADDDGDFMSLKTMLKKGSGVMLKPYVHSGVEISVLTQQDQKNVLLSEGQNKGKVAGRLIRSSDVGYLDFSDLDFTRFTFSTSDRPQVVPFCKKIKRYITLQVVVKNDSFAEGFGVYGIIKRYRIENYVKRG